MLLFIIAVLFVIPLALYAPEPEQLIDNRKSSFAERLRSTAATLVTGLAMIVVAMVTFGPNNEIDPVAAAVFGLSRPAVFGHGLLFQLFTTNLLHINVFHLVSNLSILLLLSAYERRSGWRRFTAVMLVSGVIASMGELLWLPPDSVSMGASAGLCGLAAAYIVDDPDLTPTRWLKGVLLVLLITGIYSWLGPETLRGTVGDTDPFAHLLGAVSGAVYVYWIRVRPLSER